MKVILPLLYMLFSFNSLVHASPTPTDSIKVKQAIIAKRLDNLTVSLQRVIKTNDSLNKELYYYRAKDDFYVMAIDRQGSHFEWLIGVVIAIASLLSYAWFKNQLEVLSQKQIEEDKLHEIKISGIINSLKNIRYKFYTDVSHAFIRQSPGTGTASDIFIANRISALLFFKEAYFMAEEQNRLTAEKNLINIINTVSGIIENWLSSNSNKEFTYIKLNMHTQDIDYLGNLLIDKDSPIHQAAIRLSNLLFQIRAEVDNKQI